MVLSRAPMPPRVHFENVVAIVLLLFNCSNGRRGLLGGRGVVTRERPYLILFGTLSRTFYQESTWKKGTLVHWWWECKLIQPLWKTVWRWLKTLKVELSRSIHITSGYVSKGIKVSMPKRHLHSHILFRIIHNS
jgi:hypothetical protein